MGSAAAAAHKLPPPGARSRHVARGTGHPTLHAARNTCHQQPTAHIKTSRQIALHMYDTDGHVPPVAKRARIDYNTNYEQQAAVRTTTHPILLPPQLVDIQLNKRTNEGEQPNHVLLFTVLNPTYRITCDVLHTITSPFGKLIRIVIFKKNGVQAMLEFDSLESAQRAKEALHGCDIYSACCTLKIEYAKPSKLNVYKNDAESCDYTNPMLGKGTMVEQPPPPGLQHQRPVLLKEPLVAAGQEQLTSPLAVAIRPQQLYCPPGLASTANSLQAQLSLLAPLQSLQAANPLYSPPPQTVSQYSPQQLVPQSPQTPASPASSVTMVYGLACAKMTCTRLFNLFCLYGNVVRIKFLKTKEGCAMVQMGDSLAVERCVSNLNNITFFDSKMQLGFSKQAFLADVQQPYELVDSSPSFMDFMGNKNNRFINPEMASKNRIQPPSKILHFFNTPPGLEVRDIGDIFLSAGAPRPKCIKLFPSKTERSSSGLIEFETLSESLEALVLANHMPVDNPSGKFPYIMKLCFSSSKAIPAVIH